MPERLLPQLRQQIAGSIRKCRQRAEIHMSSFNTWLSGLWHNISRKLPNVEAQILAHRPCTVKTGLAQPGQRRRRRSTLAPAFRRRLASLALKRRRTSSDHHLLLADALRMDSMGSMDSRRLGHTWESEGRQGGEKGRHQEGASLAEEERRRMAPRDVYDWTTT